MVFRKTHPEFHKINPDFINSKIIFRIYGCNFERKIHFRKNPDAILKMKINFWNFASDFS